MSEREQDAKQPHEVRIHIDQESYQSPAPTTGEALYRLGNIQGDRELYREVAGDREDEPILKGGEILHLQEDEHFHSGAKEFTIIVSGQKKLVATRKLSFDQLVHLRFDPVPQGPNILFTITYRHGPRANPDGTLLPGESVKIKDGMIFNVRATDKS